MLDIIHQHSATMLVGMIPVSFEERSPLPEQVKSVNGGSGCRGCAVGESGVRRLSQMKRKAT